MDPKEIAKLCKDKEKELLKKYFGNLVKEAASERHETIGDYTPDLPLKIEAEYRDFLVKLWNELSDQPLVLEERKLRWLKTWDDREIIEDAYKNAKRITLWEKITKTNHKDVTFYKGLLKEYTEDLLLVMRTDFLEEITGDIINCKAFIDDDNFS